MLALTEAQSGASGLDMQEVRPRLWLGSYGAACDPAALRARGVTHVLTVGVKLDLLGARQRVRLPPSEKEPLTRLVIAIQDTPSARLDRHFEACCAFLREGLSEGCGVLVHCQLGLSRSPTVVAAHLMREERLTAFQAVEAIRQRRPVIHPNMGFCDQLRAFELRLGLCKGGGCEGSVQACAEVEESDAAVEEDVCHPNDGGNECTGKHGEEDASSQLASPSQSMASQGAEEAPVDVYGTNELKQRSDKLRLKVQQLRNKTGLLSLAAPLRKRRDC